MYLNVGTCEYSFMTLFNYFSQITLLLVCALQFYYAFCVLFWLLEVFYGSTQRQCHSCSLSISHVAFKSIKQFPVTYINLVDFILYTYSLQAQSTALLNFTHAVINCSIYWNATHLI